MKKSLVALAVFGAFSGLAQADNSSVTVYGIVDAGFMTQSKAGAGAAAYKADPTALPGTLSAGSATGFDDGEILPSIYGLKGTEDLGGGLKAGFNLEGGFSTSNGTHNSPGVLQSQIFGRQADLTLGGDWGTVAAGLQIDPAFIANLGTEARGDTDSLSSLENWIIATFKNGATSGGASGGAVTLQGGIFDANSISYTYANKNLYLGLLYGVGGVAGASSANSQYSIGASYNNMGFIVAAGYVADKSAATGTGAYTGNQSSIWHVGAGYEFAPFAVRLQYSEFKYAGANAQAVVVSNGDDVKDLGLGIDWVSGANKLNFAYYNSKDTGAGAASVVGYGLGGKTNEFALLDTYSLSKRTSVYVQLASVKADINSGDSAALGGIYTVPSGGLAAVAGATTTYFGFGMQHEF